jgi:hypothetical protein
MGIALDTVERWWEHVEAHRFEDAMLLARPDADISMPGGGRFTGPAEMRPAIEAYVTAFPTMRHEIVHAVETDRAVAVELRITMHHDGPFVTPLGEIPATGRTIVLEACDVVTVDDDGAITAWHAYFDLASLVASLGVGAPVG